MFVGQVAGLARQALHGRTSLGAVMQTLSTNVLVQGLNVGTGVLTARILAPQGRGELAAMIMWPQFLAYAFTFGMPLSLIYRIRREPERTGELLGAALAIGAVSGLIATSVGAIGIPFWLIGYPPQVVLFAQWATAAAPLASLSTLLATAAQAAQEFRWYNQFRALPTVLILVVLAILAATRHLTPRTAALAYLLAGLPVLLWNATWVARKFRLSFRNAWSSGRSLLGYGIRAWGMDLIGTVSDQVDRVLVVGLLAPRDMGLYVVALSSARVFAVVPAALSSVMLPKLISMGPERGVPILARMAGAVLVGTLLVVTPLVLLAHFALDVVYGAKFVAATPIFRILLVEDVFGGATWLLAQGFVAFGKPGRSTLQQGVGLLAAIPLLLILVPLLGLEGAGFALLGSTLLRMCFAAASYRVLFKVNIDVLFFRISDFWRL